MKETPAAAWIFRIPRGTITPAAARTRTTRATCRPYSPVTDTRLWRFLPTGSAPRRSSAAQWSSTADGMILPRSLPATPEPKLPAASSVQSDQKPLHEGRLLAARQFPRRGPFRDKPIGCAAPLLCRRCITHSFSHLSSFRIFPCVFCRKASFYVI